MLMFYRHPRPGEMLRWPRKERGRIATWQDVERVCVQGDAYNLSFWPSTNKRQLIIVRTCVNVARNKPLFVNVSSVIDGFWEDMQKGLSPAVLLDYLQDEQHPVWTELVEVLPDLTQYAVRFRHSPGNWVDEAARKQLDCM